MVPLARIERATSPLPRECSTTELQRQIPLLPVRAFPAFPHFPLVPRSQADSDRLARGAGEGNRTLVVSLEGFCSTIELHPRLPPLLSSLARISPSNPLPLNQPKQGPSFWWRGKDSNLRRQSRQIYSLIPLTAREPLRTKPLIMLGFLCRVKQGWHTSRLRPLSLL